MRRYEAAFTVSVLLTIHDDDVIERTQTDEWRDGAYDLDEEGAVEMLARCLGIQGWRLTQMDGWADMDDNAVTVSTEIEMDGYQRLDGEG